MSPNFTQVGCCAETLLGMQTADEYTGKRKGGRKEAGMENVIAGEPILGENSEG